MRKPWQQIPILIVVGALTACQPLPLVVPTVTPTAEPRPSPTAEPLAEPASSPTAEPAGAGQATPLPVIVPPPGAQAEGLAIAPGQIRLDTQGLPYSWQPAVGPATPYDESMPPGPMGMPEHILVLFGVTDPADRQLGDPVMYIIPAAAYGQLWLENGNQSTVESLNRIDDVSYLLPSPPATSGYPALPYEEVGAGINDLAVQVGRIPAKAGSATKNGYRFVGRWMQDANPVINSNLRYVYQGYTNDGEYLVSFWYPVSTPALPDEVSQLSQEQQLAFNDDPTGFIAAEAERLNALSPQDWEPPLDQLDALVASLEIEGVAANGLEGRIWLWAATRNQGQEEFVAEPERYSLAFSPDGQVEVVADCISLVGTYTAEGGQSGSLQWQLPEIPNTDCGADSQSGQFLSYLPAIQNYRVRVTGNVLELPMPAGGPVLMFGKVAN